MAFESFKDKAAAEKDFSQLTERLPALAGNETDFLNGFKAGRKESKSYSKKGVPIDKLFNGCLTYAKQAEFDYREADLKAFSRNYGKMIGYLIGIFEFTVLSSDFKDVRGEFFDSKVKSLAGEIKKYMKKMNIKPESGFVRKRIESMYNRIRSDISEQQRKDTELLIDQLLH